MIKLIYFDFNFWRIDILRLSLSHSDIPYKFERLVRNEWPKNKKISIWSTSSDGFK